MRGDVMVSMFPGNRSAGRAHARRGRSSGLIMLLKEAPKLLVDVHLLLPGLRLLRVSTCCEGLT